MAAASPVGPTNPLDALGALAPLHDIRHTDSLFQLLGKDAGSLQPTCRQFSDQGRIHAVLGHALHLLDQPLRATDYTARRIVKLLLNISIDRAVDFAKTAGVRDRNELFFLCSQKLAEHHPKVALQFILRTVRKALGERQFQLFVAQYFVSISTLMSQLSLPKDREWLLKGLKKWKEKPWFKDLYAIQLISEDWKGALAQFRGRADKPCHMAQALGEKIAGLELEQAIPFWQVYRDDDHLLSFFEPIIKRHAHSEKITAVITKIARLKHNQKNFIALKLYLLAAKEIYRKDPKMAKWMIEKAKKLRTNENLQFTLLDMQLHHFALQYAENPEKARIFFDEAVATAHMHRSPYETAKALVNILKEIIGKEEFANERDRLIRELLPMDMDMSEKADFLFLCGNLLTKEEIKKLADSYLADLENPMSAYKGIVSADRSPAIASIASHHPDLAQRLLLEKPQKEEIEFEKFRDVVHAIQAINPCSYLHLDDNYDGAGIAEAPRSFWQDVPGIRKIIATKHPRGHLPPDVQLLLLLKIAEAHPDQQFVRNYMQGKSVRLEQPKEKLYQVTKK